mmetsp:Transcript_15882/g.36495  ORF Transcript_15882/g.36495 Transcript_15882/m.36495 type:complete len:280 (-) Transcript_15882:1245-2084(-)
MLNQGPGLCHHYKANCSPGGVGGVSLLARGKAPSSHGISTLTFCMSLDDPSALRSPSSSSKGSPSMSSLLSSSMSVTLWYVSSIFNPSSSRSPSSSGSPSMSSSSLSSSIPSPVGSSSSLTAACLSSATALLSVSTLESGFSDSGDFSFSLTMSLVCVDSAAWVDSSSSSSFTSVQSPCGWSKIMVGASFFSGSGSLVASSGAGVGSAATLGTSLPWKRASSSSRNAGLYTLQLVQADKTVLTAVLSFWSVMRPRDILRLPCCPRAAKTSGAIFSIASR